MGWQTRFGRKIIRNRGPRNAGNAIMMVFMAIGMAGVVTYGLNNIMRGPAVTAAEVSRRTIAENNLIATTRLAISAATRLQTNKGDCDADGFVEPMPYRVPSGTEPVPTGGGLLPMTLGGSMTDPWGVQYGYCVWDPGTEHTVSTNTACGGAGTKRLDGAPRDDQAAIAVISAGRDGIFQTACNAYVDTTPADEKPDTPLVVKGAGSDDVVLTYTYAEANGVGGGLWKLRAADPDVAEIGKNIKSTSTGGATFDGKVELKNKGIVLPGDPGDDSITGACTEGKDGQMRRNISSSPPTIQMCDFTNGTGWVQISGTANTPVIDPACTFSGFNEVWGGAGGSSFTLDGNYIYSGGADNDLFITMGTDNFTSPPYNQLYDSTNFDRSLDVAISGHYAYMPAAPNRLSVIDIASPLAPAFVGSVASANLTDPAGIAVSGNYAYVSAPGANRLTVVDISNPASPTVAGSVQDATYLGDITNIAIKGNKIFAATGNYLTVVDISTPTAPTVYAYLSLPNYSYTLALKGNTVFVGSWNNDEIYSIDITDPAAPALIGTFNSAKLHNISDMNIYGRYMVVASASFGNDPQAGVAIIDVATPSTLALVGSFQKNGAGSVVVKGQYAYLSSLYVSIHDLGCDPLEGGGDAGGGNVTSVARGVKYLPDPLDTALLAHWKMTEAQGIDTLEDSLGVYGGYLDEHASRIVGQDSSTAISFDKNDDDGIVIPGLMDQQQTGSFSGWVNISELTDNAGSVNGGTIFSIGDHLGIQEYYDDEDDGGTGVDFFYYDGSTWQGITSNVQILATGWHYIVATFDADNDMFRLYIDGLSVGEVTFPEAIDYGGLGTDTWMGVHADGGDWGMSGAVDDWRVYSDPLGPAEVRKLTDRMVSESMNGRPLIAKAAGNIQSGRIAAAQDETCAIKDDGTLWCWGRDNNQQLGNGGSGTGSMQAAPTLVNEPTSQVYYLTGTNSDIAAGGIFSKRLSPYLENTKANSGAFTALQTRTGYGLTPAGFPGVDDGSGTRPYSVVIKIDTPVACVTVRPTIHRVNAAGVSQANVVMGTAAVALTATATTFSGNIDLGTFATTDRIMVTYALVETCNGAVTAFDVYGEFNTPPIKQTPWISVSAAVDHICGVKGDGSAWCWGSDGADKLGNSNFASGLYSEPSRVVDTGAPWVSVKTGLLSTCGIQSNGTLWCWGTDADGQLGNGAGSTGAQPTPTQAGTDTDWASVSVGAAYACGVKTNGDGYCWGDDTYGQLGNGATTTTDQVSPVIMTNHGNWDKISAGYDHACGIKRDGSMWCWGHSQSRELGNSLGTNQTAPVKITAYPDGWVDVSTGTYTCGVRRDSASYCWGNSSSGRLGIGTVADNQSIPTMVRASRGTVALSAGGSHACMMKTNGTVWCWGMDNYGQLGNGQITTASQTTPYPVAGFPGSQTWGWNDAASIIAAPLNFGVGMGSGYLSPALEYRGFGFTIPGRAKILQDGTSSNQLLVTADGANTGTQVSFKSGSAVNTDYLISLVAKWLLNETSGTTASTSVGSYNGTLNNGPLWDTRGRNAGALTFDGVDDYVQVNRNVNLEPALISIAFWMKSAGPQTYDTALINKTITNGSGTPAMSYGINMDGNRLVFKTGHTDNTENELYSTSSIVPETWTYVIATFNTSLPGNKKNIYINGVLDATTSKSNALKYDTAATGRLFFGTGYVANTRKFKGSLDDIRIYNWGLTPPEAATLYSYQVGLNLTPRTLGIDYSANNFEIGRNNAASSLFMDAITADLNITPAGNVGIAQAAPAVKLDVGGAVRFGTETTCDVNRTGAIRFTSGAYTYCNGTTWTTFPGANVRWNKGPGQLTDGVDQGCAIRNTGQAYCWGGEWNGKHGNGGTNTSTNAQYPVNTNAGGGASWDDWVQIDAGEDHVCGLRADGSIWCWGANDEGQLGDNWNEAESNLPIRVQTSTGPGGWSDWTQISVGQDFACGLRADGSLWCWGDGNRGELGNNTSATWVGRPVQVQRTGSATPWTDWVYITTGGEHACGIRSNGEAYCWGNNDTRQIGIGSGTQQNRPALVHDLDGAATAPTGFSDWIQLEANQLNTCGIRANGVAYCWGDNTYSTIGDGTSTTRSRPVLLHDVDGAATAPTGFSDWKSIGTSGYAFGMCGIRGTGEAYCWGNGGNSGTGVHAGSIRPARVVTDTFAGFWTDWVNVQAGRGSSCGVRANGTVWCWGDNYGTNALGTGNYTDYYYPAPGAVIDP